MEHSEIEKVDSSQSRQACYGSRQLLLSALGEEFGYPIGTPCTGKMIAALRRLGFERVYDVNFGADLTIMEEGTELLHRLTERRRAADDHFLLTGLGQLR